MVGHVLLKVHLTSRGIYAKPERENRGSGTIYWVMAQ